MESILIWFASGFSFVCGIAFAFFCFGRKPTKADDDVKTLMQDRNNLDDQKVQALWRIVAVLENRPQ